MSRLLIFLFFCIGLSAEAQRYPKRKILKDLEELPGFENAFIGFVLYEPSNNIVIARKYADKHMTPASNTKLFTYFSADKYLNEQLHALEYIETEEDLIFWSTGYPLTLHPDQPDSTVIEFLSQTDKSLHYWPRPIEDDRYGPGWGWDDFGGYYGAEKSLFPIYGNSVQFIINSQERTFEMMPQHPGFKVTIKEETDSRARVYRDELWNEFELTFKKITPQTEQVIDTLIRPFRYSDALFVDLLSESIGKPIRTIEEFKRPQSFEVLTSHPKDSIFKWMLQPSDNLFAESLLLMSSGKFSDTLSISSVIETENDSIESMRFRTEEDRLVWVDGSGLSRYNMFTPNQMVSVLHSLLLRNGEEKLFELLPQGGVSGTIAEWYQGETGPYVYAKTGTLSNNHTLSGFIRGESGKVYIFSIMANHYTVPTNQIRENFAVILEKIRKAY